MRSWVAGFAVFVLLLGSVTAWCASPDSSTQMSQGDLEAKEFVTSCTYGVLAGTLVGAASLAFTSNPGQNLSDVAKGASIGLYAGILLGLYVVYVVPGLDENPEEEPVAKLDKIRFIIAPTFGARTASVDGLKADWTVLRF